MREFLLNILNNYLTNNIPFRELESVFYNSYVDNNADFNDVDSELFSAVCEKLDFTTDDLYDLQDDRKFGWISDKEFKIWLSNAMIEYNEKISKKTEQDQ